MRQCVRRIAQRRLDVLSRQSWIGVQQVDFCGSFTQLADDQLHWNARPANHWLSQHNGRVDLNAILGHSGPRLRQHPPPFLRNPQRQCPTPQLNHIGGQSG